MPVAKAKETTFIGKIKFRGNEKTFGIRSKDRRQHTYVMGKTGTGKTTLLENMVLQDIRAGRGLGIIDPHGEFVERVLGQIPAERTNDVVYFNPVDMEYPIGFNVLEVSNPQYKHLVVSDLLGIFTKIWANVWSARMEYILQNCIMALLDTPGTTLLGIPRILVDKDYREKIVANVKDPVVRSFWVHEYEAWRDQFRNEAIVPIQNKVGQFLNTSFIRNIVGQPTSTLNIPEVMNSGKVLLVNVSKGRVGEDNSALLGAMIITKIQLAAMERVRMEEEERKDFYLYVDEFQNFATDSFASILSEARKYRLNLVIAHQYIGQLVTDVSTKVRDAVFGNVGTMIAFRVGAGDAEFLEKEFMPEFMQQDIVGLPNHHIYVKLMVDGITSRPFSAVTLPPLQFESDPAIKEKIIRVSREQYGTPRPDVEEKIRRWSGFAGVGEEGGGGEMRAASGVQYDAQCSNCAKMTKVPFKPDGRRPVYCLSCLKQIEAGTLIPLPDRMPQVGEARYAASLRDLGIEFKSPEPVGVSRPSASASAGSRTGLGRSPALPRISVSAGRAPARAGRASGPRDRFGSPGRASPPRRPTPPPVASQFAVRVPEDRTRVSLSNLKPRSSAASPKPREKIAARQVRPAPNTDELRRVLEEFLKTSSGNSPSPAAVPPDSQTTAPAAPTLPDSVLEAEHKTETKKEPRVVKPGETVRL